MKRFLLLGAMGASLVAHGQQQFKITVTNIGEHTALPGQLTTGGQPLSPMFVAVSDGTFDIFQAGGIASNGIKKIAEGGDFVPLKNFADSQLGGAVKSDAILGSAPLTAGQSASAMIWADGSHDYLSFASMLGHTNDSFIGSSVSSGGIHLLQGGPVNTTISIYGRDAWDAGTELNTQNAADLGFRGGSGNPDDDDSRIRTSAGVLEGVGDSWKYMEHWSANDRLATIHVESVPEPASLSVIGVALVGFLRRRRKA